MKKIEWTQKHQISFDAIKDALAAAALLHHPRQSIYHVSFPFRTWRNIVAIRAKVIHVVSIIWFRINTTVFILKRTLFPSLLFLELRFGILLLLYLLQIGLFCPLVLKFEICRLYFLDAVLPYLLSLFLKL